MIIKGKHIYNRLAGAVKGRISRWYAGGPENKFIIGTVHKRLTA